MYNKLTQFRTLSNNKEELPFVREYILAINKDKSKRDINVIAEEYLNSKVASDETERKLLDRFLNGTNDENILDDGSYDFAETDANENIFIKSGPLNLASIPAASLCFRYAYAANYLISKYSGENKGEVNLLDIGCSKATFLHFWKNQFNPIWKPSLNYVGIDIRDKAIEYSKAAFPKAQFHNIDITKEELPTDKQFDTVFLMEIIEHIPIEDGHKILDKVHSLLTDNGTMIVSSPNPKKEFGQMLTNPGDHVFEYSFDEMVELLTKHNFEIEDVSGWFGRGKYIKANLDSDELKLYEKLGRLGSALRVAVMTFIRPDLAECYTIICKKKQVGQQINHNLSNYNERK